MTREERFKMDMIDEFKLMCEIVGNNGRIIVNKHRMLKALEQEPRKGEWLRMSDLSEQEDDRYKCSRCGNVVHYNDKMNLYTFNSWCGRCGSDNGRHINYEVEE